MKKYGGGRWMAKADETASTGAYRKGGPTERRALEIAKTQVLMYKGWSTCGKELWEESIRIEVRRKND
jgi:hypothetical protein